jgi:hypothetical protein
MFSRFSVNFFKVSRAKKFIAFTVPLVLGATMMKNKIIEKEVETVLCENKFLVQDKNKMDPEIQKQNEQRQIIYRFVITGGPCAGKTVKHKSFNFFQILIFFSFLFSPRLQCHILQTD